MLVYLIKMKGSWGDDGDDGSGASNRRWLPCNFTLDTHLLQAAQQAAVDKKKVRATPTCQIRNL